MVLMRAIDVRYRDPHAGLGDVGMLAVNSNSQMPVTALLLG